MKKAYHCKYCSKQMNVSYSQYKENPYCNSCLKERLSIETSKKPKLVTFGKFRPLKRQSRTA